MSMVAPKGTNLAEEGTKVADKPVERFRASQLTVVGDAKDALVVEDCQVVDESLEALQDSKDTLASVRWSPIP